MKKGPQGSNTMREGHAGDKVQEKFREVGTAVSEVAETLKAELNRVEIWWQRRLNGSIPRARHALRTPSCDHETFARIFSPRRHFSGSEMLDVYPRLRQEEDFVRDETCPPSSYQRTGAAPTRPTRWARNSRKRPT